MNNTEGNVLSFIAGIAIGALIGVLVAPNRGEETRQKIADKSKELLDELEDQLEASKKKLNDLTDNWAKKEKASANGENA